MIRFDYLRSAQPAIVRRILEVRVAARLHAPLFALGSAVTIAAAAWGIEEYRVMSAISLEAISRQQYEASRLAVSRTKVLYAHVERLIALANEVRAIQLSGDRHALRLADVGNRLAPHLWLTSISSDGGGFVVSGKARDFKALSRTIESFSKARVHYAPELVRAIRDQQTARSEPLQYELRLGGAE